MGQKEETASRPIDRVAVSFSLLSIVCSFSDQLLQGRSFLRSGTRPKLTNRREKYALRLSFSMTIPRELLLCIMVMSSPSTAITSAT